MTGANANQPALAIRDLEFRVGGGYTVLADIEMDINRGEVIGLVGMSGCGKTSLLRCVAGLVRPSAGSIRIDGTQTVGLPERKLADVRRRIGFVFQYAALLDSLTVYENVAFGLRYNTHHGEKKIREIVAERLSWVGMTGTDQMMPSSLSGGMQKRVGMARALAMDPMLLLYDEPTSGLDPIMTRAITNLISKMRGQLGVTSIVVTHDMGIVLDMCDRVGLLHAGRLVELSKPDEFRHSENPRVKQFVAGSLEGPISIGGGGQRSPEELGRDYG